jgi:signal transduction histidine kinase/tetratricopeptide (TPR) repeat protein
MKKTLLTEAIIEDTKEKIKAKEKGYLEHITKLYKSFDSNSEEDLIIQITILYISAIGIETFDFKKCIQLLDNLLHNKHLHKTDHLNRGKIYHKLGVYNHYLGNYLDSFINYNKALESYSIIIEQVNEAELLMANTMQNIGILHKLNNFVEFDKKNISFAIKIYKKHNDINGIISSYDLYAAYYQNQENNAKANYYLLKSLKLVEKTKNIKSLSICYNNLASSYASINEFEKAFEYHQKSYLLRKKINDPYLIAIHYMHLALTFQLNKEFKKCIQANKKAEKFFEQHGYKAELANIYTGLYEAYIKLKQHKLATDYLLKYLETQKIMFKFDKASAIYNSQLSFSLLEKEKEANLLRQKNKEFEIINEELKQFAYIASHDLKEPVRSLSNYVQLLKRSLKENTTSEQKDFLNYIELFSNRIFGLIKDLNQYTQLQEPVETKFIDLNESIKIIQDSLILLINERNVKIQVGTLPTIKAPASHMHDLFLNLIQNAIKYNKSNVPKITINAIENPKENIITISDNGIGIPKRNQSEIFEVFKRLHAKTEYEGTGIGLAICKKIVDQNNGRIWVESEEHKGSTFFISFPKNKLK